MISINIEKKLKAYHGQQVLHIDKQLATGSITKIYGPSGSGKTTFLKVIAGLINPEKGVIKADKETWFDAEPKLIYLPKKEISALFSSSMPCSQI
jgi:molybdate transport system ATP-binding protein